MLPKLLGLAAAQTVRLFNLSALGKAFRRRLPTIRDCFTLLETFVFQELQRQATGDDFGLAFYHYRDKDDAEVDIVVERGAHALVGIEVKAAATVTKDDFRGLRKLRKAAAERFVAGVVLYDGEICASFGDGFFAVPLRLLWEPVRVSSRT